MLCPHLLLTHKENVLCPVDNLHSYKISTVYIYAGVLLFILITKYIHLIYNLYTSRHQNGDTVWWRGFVRGRGVLSFVPVVDTQRGRGQDCHRVQARVSAAGSTFSLAQADNEM